MIAKFISATELAREAGCSVGKVIAAVEAGILTPAGRAGGHKSAAMIFERSQLETHLAALRFGGKAKAQASRPVHACRDAAEIREKASALAQARREAGK
jgi:hypothetical protein